MSSFVQHSFQGGFITSLAFKLLYPPLTNLMFWFGFISGAAPDVIEFIGRVFFGVYLKSDTHFGWINGLMKWNPAWQLHVLQDQYWHSLDEKDWKRQLNEWIGWFIINPLIVYIVFWR